MKKSLMIATAAVLVIGGFTAIDAEAAGAESKCKTCHTFDKGGSNRMGPNLFGIVGRKAGSLDGYKYGNFLKNADFTWDEENLKAWMEDSGAVAKADGKRTKMPTQRVKGEKADEIIVFLKTLK